MLLRAYRLADSNLSGAFSDRYQHDIHDANAGLLMIAD